MTIQAEGLAKLTWDDPLTGEHREYILAVGATACVGRSPDNQIHIPERHVSRKHAVINFQGGIFMLSDLGSANGTFVNEQRLAEPFPLAHGDVVRLYVPTLNFSAVVTEEEHENAKITGTLIMPAVGGNKPTLHITSGAQEGAEIPVLTPRLTIGRATANATWDISLQDRAVSRPHAEIALQDNDTWAICDLGSANGTFVNSLPAPAHELRTLVDGTVIVMGETTILFRLGN